jgi:hypothetical protein
MLHIFRADVFHKQVSFPTNAQGKFLPSYMFRQPVVPTVPILIHHSYFNFNLNNFSNTIHQLTVTKN